MAGLVEMFGRMPVRARVAAANVAAGQTQPQMRPRTLAKFRASLAIAGRQRLGVNPAPFTVGREVLARLGDRCGARIAPA
jgi:hypothetical protein